MRYYIHIPLPDDLRSKVLDVQRKYQGGDSSEPHITVIAPRQLDVMAGKLERHIIGAVEFVVSKLAPFEIIQTKVGRFEDINVIYLGVERTLLLVMLNMVLAESLSRVLLPLSDTRFENIPTPHISLVSGLNNEQFQLAWNELQEQSFFKKFLCDEIALLGKDPEDKHWHVVRKFKLSG